jgi:hypothetical protein
LGLSSPATTAAQNHRRGINPAQRAGSKAVRPTPRDRVNLSAVGCLESAESRTPGFCALCKSRCGSILSRGTAVLSVRSSRTRTQPANRSAFPKGAKDPGWQRISWNEAFGQTASELKRILRAARFCSASTAEYNRSSSSSSRQDLSPPARHPFNSVICPMCGDDPTNDCFGERGEASRGLCRYFAPAHRVDAQCCRPP